MLPVDECCATLPVTLDYRSRICLVLLVLSLAGSAHRSQGAETQEGALPNIVVILADDMGWSDLGCYGGEIETPHLDRLAAGGLRFTQFYNTSRCCPTRAALLTGLYSHQAGIGHMVGNDWLPGYQGYLNENCVTLAEVLQAAGYATLMTGKWHVGSQPGHWPLDRGFSGFWGTPSGGGVYFKETLQVRTNVFFTRDNERVELPEDFYVTDAFTDRALEMVEQTVQRKAGPFFLYLAHIAPHWPLQAKPSDIARYQGRYNVGWDRIREQRFARQLQQRLVPAHSRLSERDSEAAAWDNTPPERQADLARRMEIYAAQVDCVDQNVGKLVKKLQDLGVYENTLILFLSDNGCSAEGGPGGFSRGRPGAAIGTGLSYASVGLEWANASDTPFRKFKMSTHEGGIATPLIAALAGRDRSSGRIAAPARACDRPDAHAGGSGWCGVPRERAGEKILPPEGRSLVPVFRNETGERRALYWEHEGNQGVRQGDWKGVRTHRQKWELYNLGAGSHRNTKPCGQASRETGGTSGLMASVGRALRRMELVRVTAASPATPRICQVNGERLVRCGRWSDVPGRSTPLVRNRHSPRSTAIRRVVPE
ncbi:MAG: arylsulfatase [Planctomycetaceae bacterium]